MMKHTLRLLTLNTHSHAERQYEKKLHAFAEGIAALQPDVIALQEVSQTKSAAPAKDLWGYYSPHPQVIIGEDNHLHRAIQQLLHHGFPYYWTWMPIKTAYGNLTEGIGLMSRSPIINIQYSRISRTNDTENWKRRMLLGIQTQSQPDAMFYSTHMARWDDPEEPFLYQWKTTQSLLPPKQTLWIMGDFNNSAHVRNEGYDCMLQSGWYDTFSMAQHHDAGITVDRSIDGWRDQSLVTGMRMDQIWCNKPLSILRSQVVFDGKTLPVVSDHYGVAAEILLR